MANDYIIKNSNGKDIIYKNVEYVALTDTNGNQKIFSEDKAELRMYGKYSVKVIDYEGTVLKQEWLNTGEVFTLPEPPVHDRLVFQEWVATEYIQDGEISVLDSDIIVGPIYTTKSGLSEFDIEVTKATGLSITFNMNGTKNWGDGTSDTATTHTYSSYGKYTITCDGSQISGSYNNGLFGSSSSNSVGACKGIHIGANITAFDSFDFTYCSAVEYFTVPNTVTTIGSDSLSGLYRLKTFIFPKLNITAVNAPSLRSSFSLRNLIIPIEMNRIGALQDCISLTEVIFHRNLTSIGTLTGASIRYLTYPPQVTTIYNINRNIMMQSVKYLGDIGNITDATFYQYNYCVGIYDFRNCSKVPSITSSPFQGINKSCKIIVPDELYSEWIVATNWTTVANHICKASEVEE